MAEFSANVPRGWRVDRTFGHHIRFADNDRLGEIEYSDIAFYPGTSLDKAARLSISNSSWDPAPRIGKHVLIDGDAFYHLSGPVETASISRSTPRCAAAAWSRSASR